MTFKNDDPAAPVILAPFDGPESVAGVIADAGGFANLTPGRRVLIKPNLVAWLNAVPFPPYGVVTTTAVVEGLIRALKQHGVRDITLGDGSLVNRELGCSTRVAFENLGYDLLCRRYGVKLVDFNDGPFDPVKLDNKPLRIARALLEADFLIDVPTLKTHSQTTVSLGLKNLKGGLDEKSRRFCHGRKFDLSEMIALFAHELFPALTLIDGVYLLECGPLHTGRAHRHDLLICSRDTLNADAVGTAVLGHDPTRVRHLTALARRRGRRVDLSRMDIRGLSWNEVKFDAAQDWEWLPDDSGPVAFARQGLTGFRLPKYDDTLCTGCSLVYNPALMFILSANQGQDMGHAELLTGKEITADGSAELTFLVGDCCLAHNKKNDRIKRRVEIPGCPPETKDIARALNDHGIPADGAAFSKFMARMVEKYGEDPGFEMTHFRPAELDS
ncbi:MAG: DUF362 domain-containing protein [Proteobacteria bacterium]|nr:DUF362 domain-containing protein [Pseudomonadota bacterium]MBU1741009.1 DUF362 domain-containing protein [Pseudomonadota bacterium]